MFGFLQSKIVSILLLIGVGWLSLSAFNIHDQKERAKEQLSNIEAKIETLKQENLDAEKLLGYLKNPEYLARQVRAKLNFKSADEEVAYVYLEDEKTASASSSPEVKPSFLDRAKDWLHDLFSRKSN